MNYIDALANRIRATLPADITVPDENATELFRLYALLALAKGTATTAEDVHDAWSCWMAGIDPGHESLVPFAVLSVDTAREDAPFVAAIRSCAN